MTVKYRKGKMYSKIRCHLSRARVGDRNWHTKRYECNLLNEGVHHRQYRGESCELLAYYDREPYTWDLLVSNSKPEINCEPNCAKCGWKILIHEPYVLTEQGWGETKHYYHYGCHK